MSTEGKSWRGGSSVGQHHLPRVSYFFPRGVGEFHFGERHPMKPHRLTLTTQLVLGYGLNESMTVVQPRRANKDELEKFHSSDYLGFLEKAVPEHSEEYGEQLRKFNFGDDCPLFDGLWDYCRLYGGSSIAAAQFLGMGKSDIAINWAGGLHHAKKMEASGFCYVNDIVLGILELLRVHPRVLYIDIDVHHGDGVQEAFYNNDRVMTVSFHKYGENFFPGTGNLREIGHDRGKYFSVNVPLLDGIDDESYVNLFKTTMGPVINTFQPTVIVQQCGADSLGCDRLGCFNLSIAAHGECVRFIRSFGVPMLVVGGGGYTARNVSRCWTYETAVMLGKEEEISNELPHTVYDSFFQRDGGKLHPELSSKKNRIDNMNTRQSLERLRVNILEQLRCLHGAPSVALQEIPPSIASWISEETLNADTYDGERAFDEFTTKFNDPIVKYW